MTGKIMPSRERDASTVQAAPTPCCPRRGPPARTPGAATPACWTGCSPGLAPAARWPRSAGGTGRAAGAAVGAAGPGNLEPPPRRRGRLAVLVRRQPAARPEPAPVTTKRSNITCVNGAVPTTIIVAGLALAGYALLMTARNRRMNVPLLAAVGVLEILLLVQVGIIVARLVGGERPAGLATLIGYLIAAPLVPVAAAFWGLLERSRWGPAVIAMAGLVAAVLMVRLHQIWPVIHV
jgi:hypothetical protein